MGNGAGSGVPGATRVTPRRTGTPSRGSDTSSSGTASRVSLSWTEIEKRKTGTTTGRILSPARKLTGDARST